MRQVLIICYDYPLISAAGVIRAYQFAKWLPKFGWQPVILTAQARIVGRQDDIEVSDGPLSCPKVTANAAKIGWRLATAPYGSGEWSHRASPSNGRSMTRLWQLAAQLAVPDGKIAWLLPAVKQGLRIARSHRLEACFSISPRPTAHLVANRIARRLRIPWVADYALPWSDAYWLTGRPRAVQWLDEKIEERILRSAQRVTVAYPDIGRGLGATCGRELADRVTVVPTGFDDELFAQLTPETAGKFTVVYPGNHFCEPGRYGEVFLDAVDHWISRDPSLEGKADFVFYGKPDEALLRYRGAMAHPYVVRVEPLVSHRSCVQAILSSHLCVVNTVRHRIPAKVYECMRAGKKILALTEPGSDLAAVIGQYSAGVAVPPQDGSAIRQALEDARRCWQRPVITSGKSDRWAWLYSAEESARALASSFDELALAGVTYSGGTRIERERS